MEDELSEYNAEGWAISCYHDEVVSVPLPSNKYKKSYGVQQKLDIETVCFSGKSSEKSLFLAKIKIGSELT